MGEHVALTHLNLEGNLRPLSELGSYAIEKGDEDPRGWTVVTSQGTRIGQVDDLIVDTQAMKVRYLVVDLDDAAAGAGGEQRVLLNTDSVQLRDASREVLATQYGARGFEANAGAHAYARSTSGDTGRTTLTRSEEELHIGKREVNRGEATVRKHVETEHVREPVTRRREEVTVERRPVEAGARSNASLGEDEIRVPLMEEEVVIEKRPVVKEELVIGKRIVEERDVVETDVQREQFDINTDVDPATRERSSSRGRGSR